MLQKEIASDLLDANLQALKNNTYPGRGIVQGLSSTGKMVFQVYWIMGRSEGSRRRLFEANGEVLKVKGWDGEGSDKQNAVSGNPALLHYTAMKREGPYHIVSNGDHTDQIGQRLKQGEEEWQTFSECCYEPDPPHFTPRIAGVFDMVHHTSWMAIAKIDSGGGTGVLRQFFAQSKLSTGMGWCLTTYREDGNPLPSFKGEPYLLPLQDSAENTLQQFQQHLSATNLVALAVRSIALMDGKVDISIFNTQGQ